MADGPLTGDTFALLESWRSLVTSSTMRALGCALLSATAAALSGLLLFWAFPPYDLWPFAWFALVPLYWAIAGKSGAASFFLALAAGMVFFFGLFDWMFVLHSYRLFHQVILGLYLGSWTGLFALCLCRLGRRFGLTCALIAAPFFWVAIEYLRSNMFFLALPWGLLAHSQYRFLPIIQISSVTGAYGLSFLIVLVNSALFALLYPLIGSGKNRGRSPPGMSRAGRWGLVAAASAALTAALVYGRLNTVNHWPGKSVLVAAVQGNIPQQEKWNPQYAPFIMDRYERLSRQAARYKPDLIVWPEAATPWYLSSRSAFYPALKRLARGAGTYLLIGTAGRPKFGSPKAGKSPAFNSTILIGPGATWGKEQRYDKIRLLPFGEYMPLEKIVPWSWLDIPVPAPCVAGKRATVFSTPDFRFGTPICWENIFPGLVRGFVRGGAQFIVNCTNEAWFGKTAAPYQFVSMSVFRAVENRRFVVRCGNTGVSCVIDPCGRVVDRVKDAQGQDIFVTGILTARITLLDYQTIYTRYGDWSAEGSLILAAALIFASLKRRRPVPPARKTVHIDGPEN